MRKLRVPEKQEVRACWLVRSDICILIALCMQDYNSTTLRIGLFIGIAIPMLLRSLQLGM